MGWSGGAANRRWHRGYQPTGDEARQILAVLDRFRRERHWEPGMIWNPCTAAYEWPSPEKLAGGILEAPTDMGA